MSDTAAWCLAVLLASVGVAANGYLAWTFISDLRSGRAAELARRGVGAPRPEGPSHPAPPSARLRRACVHWYDHT